uniref:Putative plant transposon protein domain-containing protein n=1 Tax=Solanum tuberosum TaxID=4113 RepID=M1DT02_SOLTU
MSPGGLSRLPYAIAAQLLDHLAKTNKETEKDQILATLLTQLDLVAKKILELEAPDNKNDRYIPLHKRINPKVYEGGQIEDILSLILHKVEEHDKLLNEIKENVSLLNEMTAYHSIYVQLLDAQIDMARTNLDMQLRKRARGITITKEELILLRREGKSLQREEKLLSMEGLEGRYSSVREILQWHISQTFTRPRGPYIPSWVREFYIAYGDLVPKSKKKASEFRPIKSIMVRGVEVGCCSDIINDVLERATGFEHDSECLGTET